MKQKLKNTQNGITLVALVITIIVLLILAMVSIKIAIDGGLITKAKDATDTHTIGAEKEAIAIGYSEYQIDLANNKPASLTVKDATTEPTSEGWKVTFSETTGNVYTINSKGKITGPTKEEKTEDDIAMEKYALGDNLQGQAMKNLMIDDSYKNLKQLNGKNVEYLTHGPYYSNKQQETADAAIYVKYNNKAYRIVVNGSISNISNSTTKSVAMIYEPKGKEGQKVKYSYDGTQANNKEWTVLYDNGDSVEIISPESIGILELGYDDAEAQGSNKAEKAIYSYNHAIERINNYTASLVTNTNKISVRSTGSNPNNPNSRNTEKYTSDSLANWTPNQSASNLGFTTLNGVAERGDNNLEKDLVRMAYWGVLSTKKEYWLASRYVNANSSNVGFYVATVFSDGHFNGYSLPYAYLSGTAMLGSCGNTVRPVVKISLNS